VISPGSYFQLALLEPGLNMGDYTATSSPGDPVVFTLIATPGSPGMPPRDQFRLARAEMLTMDLDHIREMALGQLDRMLAGTGFDARRDVLGVMVNRWGHGYASGANALYDPDWANEDVPWVKGRQRFARIAIANSDASGIALMQTAFDQADRSVKELVQNVIRPPFSPIFPERG
jgi:spermidine dehydrogenase